MLTDLTLGTHAWAYMRAGTAAEKTAKHGLGRTPSRHSGLLREGVAGRMCGPKTLVVVSRVFTPMRGLLVNF